MEYPSLLFIFLLTAFLPSPSHLHRQNSQVQPSSAALAPQSLELDHLSAAGGGGTSHPTGWTSLASFVLPPFAPISPRVPGERCRRDSLLFIQELKNLSLWAAEMFDASAKFPTGLLHGSTMEAGNFDECMSVTNIGSMGISSKYCLSTVRLRLPASLSDHHHHASSFWGKIKNSTVIPFLKRRDILKWGLCIPSSCSAMDLQVHLQHSLEPFAEMLGGGPVVGNNVDEPDGPAVSVLVDDMDCQNSDTVGPKALSKSLSNGEIVVGTLFLIAFLLVLIGTGYDVFLRTVKDGIPAFNKQSPLEKYVMCFSAYANGLKLFEDDTSSNPLQFLNGVKFYSICLIIMGHRIFFSLGGPIMNSQYAEQFYGSFEVVFLLGGPIVVDTFFAITGCLLCYILLTEYQKYKSQISLPILYISRFIRITPLYMAIVGFYATLLPRIASGPMWPSRIVQESIWCSKNWWTNLLYINNFVQKREMCMLQSWYLSNDMQLFIIGAPIALLIAKCPNIGKLFLGISVVISCTLPFVITYLLKLEPIFPVYMETVKNLLASEVYLSIYIPTYMRAAPYFIGMCLGYFIYRHHSHQFNLSGKAAIAGYVFSTVAMVGPILGSWTFYSPDWEYDPLSAALYASLHRITWACGVCWGMFTLTTRHSWLFGRFFGWKRIFPLGRLTYSVFLVHCGLQEIDIGSLRAPIYLSIYSMSLRVMADIVMSFLLGFALSLLFEAPIISFQRVLLSSRKNKKEDEAVATVVEEVRISKNTADFLPPPYPSHHDNPSWTNDETHDVHL